MNSLKPVSQTLTEYEQGREDTRTTIKITAVVSLWLFAIWIIFYLREVL